MLAFMESNRVDIAKEVYKKTHECNVPKKRLLVEIDFFGDAPALRNEFKVWLTSDFLEESALVDASGSKAVRELYEQVNSDDLLAVCRASNGMVSVNCVYAR
jgi:hypothetical protein